MQPVLDHIMLRVTDYEASKAFFDATLPTLGLKMLKEVKEVPAICWGRGYSHAFWITGCSGQPPTSAFHIAFSAPSRAAVDAWHKACLEAGGTDNGAPGLRTNYHPNYYGAFIVGPDGHNLEAVIHYPPGVAGALMSYCSVQ